MEAAQRNIQVQKWVAILSIVLLLVKLIAYYITSSVSILTDGLESIVNVVAGLFGLYSLHLSAQPRDADHPYGHGKIEFISAAVEGVLISIAAIFILFESIINLITPVSLQKLDIGIMLIAVAGMANFFMGLLCIRTGKNNNSLALIASGKHLHSDTYSTVGILVGLILIFFTGFQWIDSAVAILISGLIFYTGFKIVRTSIAGIMDETDKTLLRKMTEILDNDRSKNWVDIHNIRIIKYGSTLHIDCHLTVPWYLNVQDAHVEIDKLGNIVRKEFGNAIELFVHSDGCLPISCPICIKNDCPVRQHAFIKRIQWTVQNMQKDEKHHEQT